MIKKPFFETSSPGAQKLEALRQLFPQAVETDELGRIRINAAQIQLAVDPTNTAALGKEEDGYELRWVGKREAYHKTSEPHQKILKPLPQESKDWDSTGNLLIKGDNLEALKLLRQSYFGEIKLIYIDPPYNTTSEAFIYRDDFTQKQSEVLEQLGYSADALEYVKNIYGARTHSGWLSFMYPRLLLAKDLLRDDGVIFISIDDNEQAQLKLLCDEVFGAQNFVSEIVWQNSSRQSDQVASEHEYVLVYGSTHEVFSKRWTRPRSVANELIVFVDEMKLRGDNLQQAEKALSKKIDEICSGDKASGGKEFSWLSNYKNLDSDWNIYYAVDLSGEGDGPPRNFNGKEIPAPPGRHWMGQEYIDELLELDRIVWRNERAYRKLFIQESEENLKSVIRLPTRNGSEELKSLLGKDVFKKPKPVNFVKKIAEYLTEKDQVVVDFFAGSGTTGEAVMRLNAEDQGNRKFILVQIPQPIDAKKQKEAHEFVTKTLKKPEATIFEITAERLRRTGMKIEAELAGKDAMKKEASGALFMPADGIKDYKLDTGFRVYELDDDPNALILRKSLADASQADVIALQEAIATPQPSQELQILANLLLAEGLPLSSNFEPLITASPQAVQVAGDVAFVLHAVPLEDLVDALRARKARGQTVQHVCVYAPWVDDDNFLQGISTLLEAEGYGSERLRLRG